MAKYLLTYWMRNAKEEQDTSYPQRSGCAKHSCFYPAKWICAYLQCCLFVLQNCWLWSLISFLLGCITHRKPWPVLLPSEIQPREPQPRQLHEEPPPRRPQREEDVAIGAPCGWTQGAESKTLMPPKLRFCTSSEAGTWPMYPWHLVSA